MLVPESIQLHGHTARWPHLEKLIGCKEDHSGDRCRTQLQQLFVTRPLLSWRPLDLIGGRKRAKPSFDSTWKHMRNMAFVSQLSMLCLHRDLQIFLKVSMKETGNSLPAVNSPQPACPQMTCRPRVQAGVGRTVTCGSRESTVNLSHTFAQVLWFLGSCI
jgi:hypothetical protein